MMMTQSERRHAIADFKLWCRERRRFIKQRLEPPDVDDRIRGGIAGLKTVQRLSPDIFALERRLGYSVEAPGKAPSGLVTPRTPRQAEEGA